MTKWVKRGLLILVGVLILGGIIYGFIPKPIESEMARATSGNLRVTIDEEARTRVKDRFTVSAPLTGTISRIDLKPGDQIEAGTVITVLKPNPPTLLDARSRAQADGNIKAAQASFSQAQSNIEAAEAKHDLAVKELARMKTLLQSKHVSQDLVDIAESQATAAKAALDSATFGKQAAEFQLQMAKAALIEDNIGADLLALEIRSPVAGRVLRVYRDSEGAVQPGEMLIELGDPGSLEIVVDLLSNDAVRVKPGMKVSIERWGGDQPLEGKVRMVEPAGFTKVSSLGVEEQRVNVVIDFVSARETWERLGDAFRVEARVIVTERANVLKVPGGALFATAEGEAVFVVVDGTARQRIVVIGQRNGLEAEVTGGLNAGDSVIVHPGDDITDGTSVKTR